MTVQNDSRVELTLAGRSLGHIAEQLEGATDPALGVTPPSRAELVRMIELLATDVRLVQRTVEGCVRRMR